MLPVQWTNSSPRSPDVMINIAASPFSYNHDEERIAILSNNAQRYNLPLFYVNHVGAQTELIFDGGSLVFDNSGDWWMNCLILKKTWPIIYLMIKP